MTIRFSLACALLLGAACAQNGGRAGGPRPLLPELESRRVFVPPLPALDALGHVVRVGRSVFVSGQLPLDSTGAVVAPGDLAVQAKQAFDNLQVALQSAGARPVDVVQLTIHVVGLRPDHPLVVSDAARAFFPASAPPAGVFLGVAALAREQALIAVSAIAMTPGIAVDQDVVQGIGR